MLKNGGKVNENVKYQCWHLVVAWEEVAAGLFMTPLKLM